MFNRLPSIDKDLEFEAPFLKGYERERAQTYLVTLETILYSRLTPSGKRMFQAVWDASKAKPMITRQMLAVRLGRASGLLQPYDIRLLNQFVAWGLLEQSKRARPLRHGMPTGYEIVYHLPANVKWGCKRVSKRRKESH
jgi:hypothetical protein